MIRILNEHVSDGDIVTAAAGSLPGMLLQAWDTSGGKRCMLEFAYSCMGWELPAAIGSKMAAPNSEVYAVIGDGTFLMNNTALVTAIKEGTKIVVILSKNHGFQVIRKLQEANTGKSFGNEFRKRDEGSGRLSGDYVGVNYAQNAESLGALGITANTEGEFRAALVEASRVVRKPVLIEIETEHPLQMPSSDAWIDFSVPEASNQDHMEQLRSDYEEARKSQKLYY